MHDLDLIEKIRNNVAQAQMKEAFADAKTLIDRGYPDHQTKFLLQQNQYAEVQEEKDMGFLTHNEAFAKQSRITYQFLKLLSEIATTAASNDAEAVTVAVDEKVEVKETSPAIPSEKVDDRELQKLISNKLKEVSWLEQGLLAAKSVCKLEVHKREGFQTYIEKGTGFLAKGNYIITNNHVIPNVAAARKCTAIFNYQHDLNGNLISLSKNRYILDPGQNNEFFLTNPDLDYTIVRVQENDQVKLSDWGALQLKTNMASEGPGTDVALTKEESRHVTIIQHPNGDPKQIALNENQIIEVLEKRLQYITDTDSGSSGSPVFNDYWKVVGLHYAAAKQPKDVDGKMVHYNEGYLMPVILEDIKGKKLEIYEAIV